VRAVTSPYVTQRFTAAGESAASAATD